MPPSDAVALKPFLPASNFEASLAFYVDLGFTSRRLTPALASMELGPFAFLLQEFEADHFAENYMMQFLVNDLQQWWVHIESLDLVQKYAVQPPRHPAVQRWGLTVAYVFAPSGVLWQFAQNPNP